jgi:hypothetical protein
LHAMLPCSLDAWKSGLIGAAQVVEPCACCRANRPVRQNRPRGASRPVQPSGLSATWIAATHLAQMREPGTEHSDARPSVTGIDRSGETCSSGHDSTRSSTRSAPRSSSRSAGRIARRNPRRVGKPLRLCIATSTDPARSSHGVSRHEPPVTQLLRRVSAMCTGRRSGRSNDICVDTTRGLRADRRVDTDSYYERAWRVAKQTDMLTYLPVERSFTPTSVRYDDSCSSDCFGKCHVILFNHLGDYNAAR